MENTNNDVKMKKKPMFGSDEKQKKLLDQLWEDLKYSEENKADFEERIRLSKLYVDGDTKEIHKTETGRSSIVVKDSLRQTLWATSQLSTPYITEKNLVKVTSTSPKNRIDIGAIEDLLNYQLQNKMDYRGIVKKSIQSYICEGIVISKVVWKSKTKDTIEKTVKARNESEYNLIMEAIEADGKVVFDERKTDEYIEIDYGTSIIIDENPDIIQIPFERFYPSPNATIIAGNDYDADYVIEMQEMTIAEIKRKGNANGWKNIDKIDEMYNETFGKGKTVGGNINSSIRSIPDRSDSALNLLRNRLLGKVSKQNTSKNRARLNVYTEYGLFDPDNNGDTVMCEIVWCGDIILYSEQSDYPDDSLPYVVVSFDQHNFSLYGNLFTEYIEDAQKVKTSLMRTYIDNVAYGNYGNGLIEKGVLDTDNLERFRNRTFGDVIEVDGRPAESYLGLQAAAIPAQHFSLFEMWSNEAEGATGFSKATQGMTDSSTPNSASGLSLVVNAGMQRINDYSDWYANKYWTPLFDMMLLLNQKFLSETTFTNISGTKDITISGKNLDIDVDISISINKSRQNDMDANRIQQVFNLAEILVQNKIVEPFILKKLFLELMRKFNLDSVALLLEDTIEKMPNGSKSIFEILTSSGVPEDQASEMAEKMSQPIVQDAQTIGEQIIQQKENEANVRKTLQRKNEEAQLESYKLKEQNQNNVNTANIGNFVSNQDVSNMALSAQQDRTGVTSALGNLNV